MIKATITYHSGPDFSEPKKHIEPFETESELQEFVKGLLLGGAKNVKAKSRPLFFRVRKFINGRVVSSQVFSDLEEAKAVGSRWAGQDGRHTYALSETTSPRC